MARKSVKIIALIVVLAVVAAALFYTYPMIMSKLFPKNNTNNQNSNNNQTGQTNRNPVAVILVNGEKGTSFTFRVGEVIQFNGTSSYDPDTGDAIAYYEWSFGDGTIAKNASYAKNYTRAGDYTVRLTVEDKKGGRGAADVNVTIKPADVEQTVSSFVHKGIFLAEFENQSFNFDVMEDAQNASVEVSMMGFGIYGGPGAAGIKITLSNPAGTIIRSNETEVMISATITYTLEAAELQPGQFTLNVICTKGTVSLTININVRY